MRAGGGGGGGVYILHHSYSVDRGYREPVVVCVCVCVLESVCNPIAPVGLHQGRSERRTELVQV